MTLGLFTVGAAFVLVVGWFVLSPNVDYHVPMKKTWWEL
jgi:hypothetical protein